MSQHQMQDGVRILFGGGRSGPDWDTLSEILGQGFTNMRQVPHPQRDEEVIFFTREEMSKSQAQECWDNWDWQYEEDQGRM